MESNMYNFIPVWSIQLHIILSEITPVIFDMYPVYVHLSIYRIFQYRESITIFRPIHIHHISTRFRLKINFPPGKSKRMRNIFIIIVKFHKPLICLVIDDHGSPVATIRMTKKRGNIKSLSIRCVIHRKSVNRTHD